MQPDAAPFYADLAEGPALSRGFWVTSSDGMRLRLAHFPAQAGGARGTVLIFPGRTEYVEKYGRFALDLAQAGYHSMAIDWRGQGLSDRMLADPSTGHVHVFEDYQQDVAAMFAAVDQLDLPRPLHLVAHSMGGCIGLRAVMDKLPVVSCVFTGPMWGIRMAEPLRPAAWLLSWGSRRLGLSHQPTPGTTGGSYVLTNCFEANTLTSDPEMWDYMRRQVLARPELQLGGPSLHWLHEALRETRILSRRPTPPLPCLCFTGSNERIVDVARIERVMSRWRDGKLVMIPEAEHEILMESPQIRHNVLCQMLDLFKNSAERPALTA